MVIDDPWRTITFVRTKRPGTDDSVFTRYKIILRLTGVTLPSHDRLIVDEVHYRVIDAYTVITSATRQVFTTLTVEKLTEEQP
jgi:hypothetical protein